MHYVHALIGSGVTFVELHTPYYRSRARSLRTRIEEHSQKMSQKLGLRVLSKNKGVKASFEDACLAGARRSCHVVLPVLHLVQQLMLGGFARFAGLVPCAAC